MGARSGRLAASSRTRFVTISLRCGGRLATMWAQTCRMPHKSRRISADASRPGRGGESTNEEVKTDAAARRRPRNRSRRIRLRRQQVVILVDHRGQRCVDHRCTRDDRSAGQRGHDHRRSIQPGERSRSDEAERRGHGRRQRARRALRHADAVQPRDRQVRAPVGREHDSQRRLFGVDAEASGQHQIP